MNQERWIKLGGALLLVVLLVIGFYASFLYHKPYVPFAEFDDHALHSEAVVLLDRETKNIIYSKNPEKKLAPASLTKMLTVYTALMKGIDWEQEVTVDTPSYQRLVELNASMAGFFGGEQLLAKDLLYGTMLPSGGEAAMSLAITVSGNEEDFVFEMMQVAKSIPMENSNFTNVVGMDDDVMQSTAKDLAMFLDKALEDNGFREIFTKKLYWSTKNPNHPDGLLLENTVLKEVPQDGHPGIAILGGKSGTTQGAGLCWATLAKVGEKEYVLVTLHAPMEKESQLPQWQDALLVLKQLLPPEEQENIKDFVPIRAPWSRPGEDTEATDDGQESQEGNSGTDDVEGGQNNE